MPAPTEEEDIRDSIQPLPTSRPIAPQPVWPGAYAHSGGPAWYSYALHSEAQQQQGNTTFGDSDGVPAGSPTHPQPQTGGLVEAMPVVEDIDQEIIAAAQEVDLDAQHAIKAQNEHNLRSMGACALVLVMCVVLATVVGVVLRHQHSGRIVVATISRNTTSLGPPTPAPTAYVLSLPVFTLEALEDPDSPQSQAYRWLEADPNLAEYSESKRVQRMALATFYYATLGDSWLINKRWMSYEIDECNWYSKLNQSSNATIEGWGFSTIGQISGEDICDKDGNFWGLVLTSDALAGTLPPEIALLSSLERLDISGNAVAGSLPTELGIMTNLRELAVQSNKIAGSLLSELGLMTSLELLIARSTELTGTLPTELGNMVSLLQVEISGTLITGSIPSEIQYIKSLNYFAVQSNLLTGTLPSEVGRLPGLDYFRVNVNMLTGTIPTQLGLLTNLTFLGVNHNPFQGTLPTELGNLQDVQNLMIMESEITGTIPTEYTTMTNLHLLAMSSLLLTGTIPLGLWTLPFTVAVEFSNNPGLDGSIPTEIGLAKNLEALFATFNPTWIGTIPSEIGLLSRLEWLGIQYGHFSGTVPTELAGLTNLHQLDMHGNPLTGTFPKEFANHSLLSLVMNETMLTGEVPDALCAVPSLLFDCPDMCGCDCPCSKEMLNATVQKSNETGA